MSQQSNNLNVWWQRLQQPWLKNFPGDESGSTMPRQTPGKLYSITPTQEFDSAHLIHYNKPLAAELGLPQSLGEEFVSILNAQLPSDVQTYATAYSGHQFGQWAGQLGDGRAILLGEITTNDGHAYEWQWKGAGATAYARRADGRAVLRSTIREYLMSEAMHHLGVPTSRALSISLTGENVVRDVMYDGNAAYEKGAMMIRLAESFLRFGHFEFLAAQRDEKLLKDLLDFAIERYFPNIDLQSEKAYVQWFEEVCSRTLDLMVHWQRVGFVHGVMNTDNMSALGLTIDYGPYSMLDDYDLEFTPNTTDLPGKRYKFGAQPAVALWNLNRLANAIALIEKDTQSLESALNNYNDRFWEKFDRTMLHKLGLSGELQEQKVWSRKSQKLLSTQRLDYNLFYTCLGSWKDGMSVKEHFETCMYHEPTEMQLQELKTFIDDWQKQREDDVWSVEHSSKAMAANNPQFVLRNYQLLLCTQQAEKGNFAMFHDLYKALQTPYQSTELSKKYNQKRPDWAIDVVGAGQLSCSS
ncbi:MAG: YdiU family protein [Weeksellaceae bacterium]|nr:YdiU family protein [Weeksellaceae bacterium]